MKRDYEMRAGMLLTEEREKKEIITEEGETEFQVRYIKGDEAGVITTRSGKHFFTLDSHDYWYDNTQESYPKRQRCQCKHYYFKLHYIYISRPESVGESEIEIYTRCCRCGREEMIGAIDVNSSQLHQMFEQPIILCKEPKLKHRIHKIIGYWTAEEFSQLIDLIVQRGFMIYCCYWNYNEDKRMMSLFTGDQLRDYLFNKRYSFFDLLFSLQPLDELINSSKSSDIGIHISDDIWRRDEIIHLREINKFSGTSDIIQYSMTFSSQIIIDGQVNEKSQHFTQSVEEIVKLCNKILKKI